jgi:hypothetical protein
MSPLSSQDIEAYIRNGFILLKQAFSPQIAQACREEVWKVMKETADIDKGDPATWPVKFPLAEIYGAKEGTPWADVFTPRLRQAVDQLCGKDQWEEFGCGWWMMTFPQQQQQQQEEEKLAWGGLDGHWHIDGTTRQRCLHTREVGLVPIFLFSDVAPGGGGTALCRGSHHFVAQLLHEAGPAGSDALEIIQRGKVYAKEKPHDEIVETVGQAGDVMFTHPFLIHGRSRNCAVAREGSEAGVRFMCHPSVRLKAFPSFEASQGKEMTPLEQGILQGIRSKEEQEEEENERSEVRIWTHDQCHSAALSNPKGEGGAPQKRKQQRHGQEVEDEEEEAVDADVLEIMGLSGFGGVGRGGANKKKKKSR